MSNTLNLGNGNWGVKKDSLLGYNSENGNYKPLPFDFTRASSATVVNKDGLIETVGSGEPRIDFKDNTKGSLLLEPQRSNVITYSNDFSNAIWTNTGAAISVNPTADLSPDGTLTGNEFNEGTSSGRRGVYEDISVSANQSHTLSVFIKKGTGNYFRLVIAQYGAATDWTAVQVDLSDNSLSTNNGSGNSFTDISSSVSSVDYNGYYKLTLTAKHPTATSLRLLFCTSNGNAIAPSNSYARPDYTGTNKTVYIFGAQLEQGSYPTSYIPTSGQANGVTRVAESSSQTVPDGVIGQTEGTMYVNAESDNAENAGRLIAISDGTPNNRIMIRYSSNDLLIYAQTTTQQWNYTFSRDENMKIGIAYANNDAVLYLNGVQLNSLTSFNVPNCSKVFIGTPEDGGSSDTNVKINEFKLYNTRLSNSELAALTS